MFFSYEHILHKRTLNVVEIMIAFGLWESGFGLLGSQLPFQLAVEEGYSLSKDQKCDLVASTCHCAKVSFILAPESNTNIREV